MTTAVRAAAPALPLAPAAGCVRPGGGALVRGLALPRTDAEGNADAYGVRARMGAELGGEELNARVPRGGRDLDGSPAPEGAAGSVTFDEHGDPVDKRFTMGVIQGGAIALPRGAR